MSDPDRFTCTSLPFLILSAFSLGAALVISPTGRTPQWAACTRTTPSPQWSEDLSHACSAARAFWNDSTSFYALPELTGPLYAIAAPLRLGACDARGASWKSLARLLIGAGPQLKVLALGGSETAGVGCAEGDRKLKACAWPARLASALGELLPDTSISIVNFATGGTTSSAALPALPHWLALTDPGSPVLLLVDYSVNDNVLDGADLLARYETLLLATQRLRPGAVVVFMNACAMERCNAFNEFVKRIGQWHHVPVISYPDFIASIAMAFREPQASLRYWGEGFVPHPPWFIHQALADTATACFKEALQTFACDSTFAQTEQLFHPQLISQPESLSKVGICDMPTSYYSATDAFHNSTLQTPVGVDWELVEDRVGKPGWISLSSNAQISFLLTFGAHPRLIVSFLRSYENLGNALLFFDDLPDKIVILDGLVAAQDERYSQYFAINFEVDRTDCFQQEHGDSGCYGFGIRPFSSHVLKIHAQARGDIFKFKIVSIVAC